MTCNSQTDNFTKIKLEPKVNFFVFKITIKKTVACYPCQILTDFQVNNRFIFTKFDTTL